MNDLSDFLDTVKGSLTSCTRPDFACQALTADRRDYNLQTINIIADPGRIESESDWKVVHELNAEATISEKLSVIKDFVFGSEDDAVIVNSRDHAYWYGGLFGARVQLTDRTYISPRYEIYRDVNDLTLGGPPQTLNSFTITFGQQLTPNFEIRLEGRGDFSTEPTFAKDSSTAKSQPSILIATLFNF